MNDDLRRFIRACTQVHDAEVHVDTAGAAKIPTKIVLLGKQGGRDYVRIFELRIPTMVELIDLLAGLLEYHVKVGRIDAPGDIPDAIRDQLHGRRWRG